MSNENQSSKAWLASRKAMMIILLFAIFLLFLFTGHSTHVLSIVPYLLLLACPLLHMFMHGKHRKHNDGKHA